MKIVDLPTTCSRCGQKPQQDMRFVRSDTRGLLCIVCDHDRLLSEITRLEQKIGQLEGIFGVCQRCMRNSACNPFVVSVGAGNDAVEKKVCELCYIDVGRLKLEWFKGYKKEEATS